MCNLHMQMMYLYALTSDVGWIKGRVKIGKTENPVQRLRQYRTSHGMCRYIVLAVPFDSDAERKLLDSLPCCSRLEPENEEESKRLSEFYAHPVDGGCEHRLFHGNIEELKEHFLQTVNCVAFHGSEIDILLRHSMETSHTCSSQD